jgi:hypothetical protein
MEQDRAITSTGGRGVVLSEVETRPLRHDGGAVSARIKTGSVQQIEKQCKEADRDYCCPTSALERQHAQRASTTALQTPVYSSEHDAFKQQHGDDSSHFDHCIS